MCLGYRLLWFDLLRFWLSVRLRERLLLPMPAWCGRDDDELLPYTRCHWSEQPLQGQGQGFLRDMLRLEPLQ